MEITRRLLLCLLAGGLAASSLSAAAQTLLATVDTGTTPVAEACHSSKHRTPAISMTWQQARLATFR
jgi:hypothetical protein